MKSDNTNNFNFDIAVIGGGPAGTSAACHASTLGLKTILFEKKTYPREKPCGGALSERCIPFLGTHALQSINCQMEELQLYSPSFKRFICDPLPGRFIIRKEFDHAMAKDAQHAGADVKDNCPVQQILPLPQGGFEIISTSKKCTARYLIMASGYPNTKLLKQLGIRDKYEKDYLAICLVSETPINNKVLEKTDFNKKVLGIFFGAVPNGYGWYFVKNGYINIGVGATAQLIKNQSIRQAYNNFVQNLKTNGFLPNELELKKAEGYPLPFKKTAEKTVFGNILLVGDTAGFVSPVTGEGLYYSLKGGQLAAEAIAKNKQNGTPLENYHQTCLEEFGNDLNKHGYHLREMLYKTKRRMEFAVTSGRHDKLFADIVKYMIIGLYSYKKTIHQSLLRLPVTLLKMIF